MNADSLLNLLRQLGIQNLRLRGQNLVGCCPNHQERRPSWGMRVDPPHMHGCFTCGFKGSLALLLTRTFKWSKAEAENLLGAADVFDAVEQAQFQFTELEELAPVVPLSSLFPFVRNIAGRVYLYNRGLTDQTIEVAGLLHDRAQNRLVFPWFYDRELYGCTGRRMNDEDSSVAKIVAYYGLRKGQHFYVPNRRLVSELPLILVEGEIDALKVFQSGFTNVAALSFGRFSATQLRLLSAIAPRKVLLFFDNDVTGLRLTADVTSTLKNYMPVSAVDYSVSIHAGKLDPGGMTEPAIRKILAQADEKPARNFPGLSL